MHHRQIARRRVQVAALVIEEDVGLENRQDARFLHATQEETLVGRHAPIFEGRHHPLMGRCIACRDDGNAQDARVVRVIFELAVFERANQRQLAIQVGQGPGRMGHALMGLLVGLELIQAVATLVDAFGFVVGDHAIEVERHAQLGIDFVIVDTGRQNTACGVIGVNGFLYVLFVGAQKQRCVERWYVLIR